ncbi:MAG: prephenate dehydrogenase/arogenate dehydrogenase family protein, partial [Sulfurimonas sp.]|nr:prephenate dehydrogenase/arogenate dehydrogenase family protein [Sulfurimonas sp.]
MKIAIIGLGLMGGSLAMSLKEQKYVTDIVGYDYNEVHTAQALELGLVNSIASFSEVKKCDVIFLAIPVDGLIATLHNLTDVSA